MDHASTQSQEQAPWDRTIATTTVGSTLPSSEGGGSSDAAALSAARAHLAAVSEELALLQRHFDDERSSAELAAAEKAAAQADEMRRRASRQGAPVDEATRVRQELQLQVAQLEVDLESANARADRLAAEKQALLGAQARMEASLRNARADMEELRRQLGHRDLELQRLGGAAQGGKAFLKALPREMAAPASDPQQPAPPKEAKAAGGPGAAVRLECEVLSGVTETVAKPLPMLSKQQALAALVAAQVELREERKRRAQLERRIQKDKERLERFVNVAEQQSGEIRSATGRAEHAEAAAVEWMLLFQEGQARSGAPVAVNQQGAANAITIAEAKAALVGEGVAPALPRTQSVPTRLPVVQKRGG